MMMSLVMQIGSFDDWNIDNPNSVKLSSENVNCTEKPHSPRGGNNIFSLFIIYLFILFQPAQALIGSLGWHLKRIMCPDALC